MIRSFVFLLFLLILTACVPSSLQEVRKEGRKVQLELTQKLSAIRTREQLIDSQEVLSEHFEHLADLMIEGWERYNSHAKEERLPLSEQDHRLSIDLEAEMARVTQLDEELLFSCRRRGERKLHLYLQKNLNNF